MKIDNGFWSVIDDKLHKTVYKHNKCVYHIKYEYILNNSILNCMQFFEFTKYEKKYR